MTRILIFIGVVFFTFGCDDPNQDCCDVTQEIDLGVPFSIAEGETVDVENSIVNITFTRLIFDSLCPEDIQCVTQGSLTISVDINGTEKQLSIGDIDKPRADYKNYLIELQKLIYPAKQDEKANRNSTYAVQMMITRP